MSEYLKASRASTIDLELDAKLTKIAENAVPKEIQLDGHRQNIFWPDVNSTPISILKDDPESPIRPLSKSWSAASDSIGIVLIL